VFTSLSSVTYPVTDLNKAKQWYGEMLGMNPVSETPLAVIFRIGDGMLALLPADKAPAEACERAVAYWNVEDIDAAFQRMLDLGGTRHTDIYANAPGSRIARVADPFGNILGIISRSPAARKSLDDQPSDSAMGVTLWRALAAREERAELRGPDTLAEIFLTEDFRKLLNDEASRDWIVRKMPGNLEFFLARTLWFDTAFREALRNGFPQIVLLGAGYDSRGWRFCDRLGGTRVFELDVAPTQQRKIRVLQQANAPIPPQIVFVPVNFVRDRLEDVLRAAGFDRERLTLFLWEGVSYYLPGPSVEATLEFVRTNAPAGSLLCFDYMADAPDLHERYGVREALDAMRATYLAEPVQFRLPEGTAESFLRERGFRVIEHLTENEMEKMIVRPEGSPVGRMLACFRLVKASPIP